MASKEDCSEGETKTNEPQNRANITTALPPHLLERIDFTQEKADHAIKMMARQALVLKAQQDVIDYLQSVMQQQSDALRKIILMVDKVVPCYVTLPFNCKAMSDMDVTHLDQPSRDDWLETHAHGNVVLRWKELIHELTKTIDNEGC